MQVINKGKSTLHEVGGRIVGMDPDGPDGDRWQDHFHIKISESLDARRITRRTSQTEVMLIVLPKGQDGVDCCQKAVYQRTIGVKPIKLGEVPLVGGLPSSEEEAVALAMDGGPLPTNAQYLITAASYGVNSAVGALLPQVNLVGTVQQQFDVVVPGDAYMNYILGIQATIPLYQGGGEWSKIRQAKELVGQRRSNLDSARRLAAQNTISAWRGTFAGHVLRGAGAGQ